MFQIDLVHKFTILNLQFTINMFHIGLTHKFTIYNFKFTVYN